MSGQPAEAVWVAATRKRLRDERIEIQTKADREKLRKEAAEMLKRHDLRDAYPGYAGHVTRIQEVVAMLFKSVHLNEMCWMSFHEVHIEVSIFGQVNSKYAFRELFTKDVGLRYTQRIQFPLSLSCDMQEALAEDVCSWAKRMGLDAGYTKVSGATHPEIKVPLLDNQFLMISGQEEFPYGLKHGDYVVCARIRDSEYWPAK